MCALNGQGALPDASMALIRDKVKLPHTIRQSQSGETIKPLLNSISSIIALADSANTVLLK